MMIAFITINIGLVPMIEGLSAQIIYILFLRLSVVCVHIFCFSFSMEKTCQRKKHLVQDLIPPLSIYIHICCIRLRHVLELNGYCQYSISDIVEHRLFSQVLLKIIFLVILRFVSTSPRYKNHLAQSFRWAPSNHT